MPAQNRVRRHDCDKFSQHATTKSFPRSCQASTLIIIETKPLSPVQLLKNPNLLLQELNLLPLLFVKPPSDGEEQHSNWHSQHGLQFTRSRTGLCALKRSAFQRAYLLIKHRLSVQLIIGTARPMEIMRRLAVYQ